MLCFYGLGSAQIGKHISQEHRKTRTNRPVCIRVTLSLLIPSHNLEGLHQVFESASGSDPQQHAFVRIDQHGTAHGQIERPGYD